jgi:PIN domain nuclease of toxin-antitoxin system
MIAAIADTHTAVWYIFADARLSAQAQRAIEAAARVIPIAECGLISPQSASAYRLIMTARLRVSCHMLRKVDVSKDIGP